MISSVFSEKNGAHVRAFSFIVMGDVSKNMIPPLDLTSLRSNSKYGIDS